MPRPALQHVHVWQEEPWAYRAELYAYAPAIVISRSPVLDHNPVLPNAWCAGLRTALDTLATVPTERVAVREEYARRSVPQYTGHDVGEIE
ncbi:hypothetical protein ACIGZH_15875 [Streptomyces sp. NPDC058319]|uniref:hypothetical protein n=1 Tax=unclassified Streptomyces TaxID=2593676 RepID=UPI0036F0D1DA